MAERDSGSRSPPSPPTSVQVIERVASHLEREPTEVDFTFSDYLDPDALDTLLESATEDLVVAFTMEGLLVTVATDGTIEVRAYRD